MADENTTSAQEGTAQSQPAGGSATAGARTFTEDKVNEIVRDRLAREREKYADYEDAKAKAKQTDELKAALETLTQERDAANVELEGLKAQKEHAQLAAKVAQDAGIPAEAVLMLRGDTEEELAENVASLLKLIPAHPLRTDDGGSAAPVAKTTAQKFADSLENVL